MLEAFTRELPRALGVPPDRVILIFDADRKAIYAGLPAGTVRGCRTRAVLANQRLAQLARSAGLRVIDAEPVFRQHYAAGLGPLDRSPLDAHWNPAAHGLIAREVARVIEGSKATP